MQIEFTDDTLIQTEQGIERLADLIKRPVKQVLWGIKWVFDERTPNGISFHASHRGLRSFRNMQFNLAPIGPARLIEVSDHIYDCVCKHEYCWTNLSEFDQAASYEGETWKH